MDADTCYKSFLELHRSRSLLRGTVDIVAVRVDWRTACRKAGLRPVIGEMRASRDRCDGRVRLSK